jgi:hypothetical protein
MNYRVSVRTLNGLLVVPDVLSQAQLIASGFGSYSESHEPVNLVVNVSDFIESQLRYSTSQIKVSDLLEAKWFLSGLSTNIDLLSPKNYIKFYEVSKYFIARMGLIGLVFYSIPDCNIRVVPTAPLKLFEQMEYLDFPDFLNVDSAVGNRLALQTSVATYNEFYTYLFSNRKYLIKMFKHISSSNSEYHSCLAYRDIYRDVYKLDGSEEDEGHFKMISSLIVCMSACVNDNIVIFRRGDQLAK